MSIIILSTTILMIIFILLQITKYKKNLSEEVIEQHQWMELINDFKQKSPSIKNADQLSKYLTSIQGQVENYQTDYNFLFAFNSAIREVREQLKDFD